MQKIPVFERIKVGMNVVQMSDDEQIGEVEVVRFGEGATEIETLGLDTIIKAMTGDINSQQNMPDEVYQRLYSEGFIRIERGLEPDAYAFPGDIERVEDDTVYLKVDEDDLLKE